MRIRTLAVAAVAAVLGATLASALTPCTFPYRASLSAQSVDPLDAAHLRRLTLTELSSVGGEDDREGYMLSSVSLAAVTAPDAFAFIDTGVKEVRVFGTDGVLRQVLGGEGEGPGEFKAPMGLGALWDGGLLAWDMLLRRTIVFDPDGNVASTAALPTGNNMEVFSSFFVGAFPDGSWVLRAGAGPMDWQRLPEGPVRDTVHFRHVSAQGEVLGEIVAVAGPERTVMHRSSERGTSSPGTPIFGRDMVYAVSGDALVVGLTDSLFLQRYSEDGTPLEPLALHRPPHPASRADVQRERQRRIEEARKMGEAMARIAGPMGPDFAEEQTKRTIDVVENIGAEETWPAFEALKTGPGGEVWIEDVNAAGVKTHRWIRFTDGFKPDGWIELPEGDALLAVGHGLALVRTEDELDVQTLVCYRVGTP